MTVDRSLQTESFRKRNHGIRTRSRSRPDNVADGEKCARISDHLPYISIHQFRVYLYIYQTAVCALHAGGTFLYFFSSQFSLFSPGARARAERDDRDHCSRLCIERQRAIWPFLLGHICVYMPTCTDTRKYRRIHLFLASEFFVCIYRYDMVRLHV